MTTHQLATSLEQTFGVPGLATRSQMLQCLQSRETNDIVHLGLRSLEHSPAWWRQELGNRLADESADLDSVLGEIRAYGVLSAAGFKITPVPTGNAATPDFELSSRDGTTIIIDVATKNWDLKERQALQDFQSAPVRPNAHEQIVFREHCSAPFGAPSIDPVSGQVKNGDSVTANVVQRVCGVKQKETQFKIGEVNLLYLDLARGEGLSLIDLDSTLPLRQFREDLTSGELFAAFFGRKGMPIYDGRPLTYGAHGMTAMGHDGRFRMNSKLSGVLVSCRSGLALLENPWCAAPLTRATRRQLLECYTAQLEYFWACFVSSLDLEARIEQGIGMLEHFSDIDADD